MGKFHTPIQTKSGAFSLGEADFIPYTRRMFSEWHPYMYHNVHCFFVAKVIACMVVPAVKGQEGVWFQGVHNSSGRDSYHSGTTCPMPHDHSL